MQVEIDGILPTSTPDPAQPILADVRASARLAARHRPGAGRRAAVRVRRAGTERVIVTPTGPDWQRDYEFAGKVRAAL